ncbi:Nop-domain-containing protein [Panus rudis PR-1116 ss-1]|nr:Nop-domain-containing protein [Panus rudis PR-1116 ss-1]
MLVLYETSLGYCLFKLNNDGKVSSDDVWKDFETPERASSLLKLKAIHRFTSTATAVEEITAIQEGKLGKGLKQFLSDEVVGKGKGKEQLAVVDPKLGHSISKKLGIKVVPDASTDLFRGIRSQLAALLDGLDPQDLATMSLGLSHSLSRFKLKFSPDKVDTMVVQAIALLDDLDKEINIYAMRYVQEWYGWHFPEMAKIIVDNVAYAKVVKAMGFRTNAATTDFSSILPEDLEATIRAAAEISMGTEISDSDIAHINALCDQVISISAYRAQLAEYLRNRMNAIAPNLTALVGELVGARLISHAGSLLNLAKHPASTVQILGAEKALFRALKTKHDTPKYGLIYHASLIGQAPPKLKGKMARMVATKAALSIRVDALTDADDKSEPSAPSIGIENRAKLEARLRALEEGGNATSIRAANGGRKQQRFQMSGDTKTYNTAADDVDLVSTQREPAERALQAALDVKAEKKKAKEERKAKKKSEKAAEPSGGEDGNGMDVDGEDSKKEKKRKRRESEANGNTETTEVCIPAPGLLDQTHDGVQTQETEEERKARKKARKAEKAAAEAGGDSSKKKRRKSEA